MDVWNRQFKTLVKMLTLDQLGKARKENGLGLVSNIK